MKDNPGPGQYAVPDPMDEAGKGTAHPPPPRDSNRQARLASAAVTMMLRHSCHHEHLCILPSLMPSLDRPPHSQRSCAGLKNGGAITTASRQDLTHIRAHQGKPGPGAYQDMQSFKKTQDPPMGAAHTAHAQRSALFMRIKPDESQVMIEIMSISCGLLLS